MAENSVHNTMPSKNPTSFAAKRKARRFAMQGIYEWQLTQNPAHEIAAHTRSENAMHKVDLDYYHELLQETIKQISQLDELAQPFLDRQTEALGGVEQAILRLGSYELKNRLEIPYRVVLDEAIELAKDFGAADSYKYINGVLHHVAESTRQTEIAMGTKPTKSIPK